MMAGTRIVSFMMALAGCVCAAQDRQHVVIVLGADGTPAFGQMFSDWADRWAAAARSGEARLDLIGRDQETSDLEVVHQKISEAASIKTSEPLWVVLIGHGTFDGRVARFNLRGKDLSSDTAATLLDTSQRPVAIINCTSCSSPFINALSGPGRIVITGTKDGGEIQFARFGQFIAAAVGELDADIDRDGQTSLLEAWLYAARKTEEFYESNGRLATEHSLLDDSGDGKGTRANLFEGIRPKENIKDKEALDGKLARRWHLVRSDAEKSLSTEQRQKRDQLEEELEKLRKKKSNLSESEYLRQLENIVLPLAKLYDAAQSAPTEPERTREEKP